MKKFLTTKYLLLVAILILASFFRLYNITQTPPGLYPDEAMDGTNALEAIRNTNFSAQGGPAIGWKVFYPENNGREGLFMNLQTISIELMGNTPEALRIVSVIFGILTVLGIYFLARELFLKARPGNPPHPYSPSRSAMAGRGGRSILGCGGRYQVSSYATALLATFFIAVSFWHIMFSRISFRAIMAPFFIVWAMYFLLKAIRQSSSDPNSKFYILNSILSGICLGLGFYSYIAFRVMPLLIAATLFLEWLQTKDAALRGRLWIILGLVVLISVIVFAPLGLYFLHNPKDFTGRTSEISVFSAKSPLKDLFVNIAKTIGMFFVAGDYNWRQNYAGAPEFFWPVALALLVGAIAGLRQMWSDIFRRKFSPFWSLFLWIALAMLPVVFSDEGIPHALRSILMIPPTIILAGYGGVLLYHHTQNATAVSPWMNPHTYIIGVGMNGRPSNAKRIGRCRTRKGVVVYHWLYEKFRRITRKRWILPALATLVLLFITVDAYDMYFNQWAHNPNVPGAFSADYAALGNQLNSLPREMPKYVIVEAHGVLVRGIPMPAQTVMYITDTFLPQKQKEKNIFYILPKDKNKITQGAYTAVIR